MNSNPSELLELAIWKEIAGEALSVSHDHWHIDRVLDFARQLQAIHGGDLDVITTAVILHDLGRSDQSFMGRRASANRSSRPAESWIESAFCLTKSSRFCRLSLSMINLT